MISPVDKEVRDARGVLPEYRGRRRLVGPTADEVLRLEDGRLLAWAEWGDPQGVPVLFLHCSPGSRMFCPDDDATGAAGVRLITVDRPGYGGSDASSRPTLIGFANDLGRLIDHLWLGRISVVGWSGGGQFAAACAALLRDRVDSLVLAATPAPDEHVRWVPDSIRPLAEWANADPAGALQSARQVSRVLVDGPERAGDSWDATADRIIRSRPGVEGALVCMWREALRTGADGLAADLVAASTAWQLDLAEVTAHSHLFYGEDDTVVG
ncbi:MAG TPA: alpha/beta hydrolase, partial [Acidimicrobiales bacterium]|nr:alpha/beta hydrolase [Acidimicrobiales bacterium]